MPLISTRIIPESAVCLVVAAVFKTVEGQSVLGGFDSFPLRQSFSLNVGLGPIGNSFDVAPQGGDRAGLSEVAFAVPVREPSSALLALLRLPGLARRRR